MLLPIRANDITKQWHLIFNITPALANMATTLTRRDVWLPVGNTFVCVVIATRGVGEAIATVIYSLLLCLCLLWCDSRWFSLQHALRVSSATYYVICWQEVKGDYLVTNSEHADQDFWFHLCLWSAVCSWTVNAYLATGITPGAASLPWLGEVKVNFNVVARWLQHIAIIIQIIATVITTVRLLTCACVPTMLFGSILFPDDCSSVFQRDLSWRQYVRALLCALTLLPFACCSVWNLLEDVWRLPWSYLCRTCAESKLQRICCLSLLLYMGYLVLSAFGLFQSKQPLCQTMSRVTVHPISLPRLNVNTSAPFCMYNFTGKAITDIPQPLEWTWRETERIQGVATGGSWRPRDCVPWQRVAILVPFRDREVQLVQFLTVLHPLLQRQQIHYRIFLVEQAGDLAFNRGKIKNVGFLEASKLDTFDCFIFHDVDMLPETEDNLHLCDVTPRHLSPALNEMRYALVSTNLFGGVVAMTGEQFRRLNGYTNIIWGWGAEDDDLSARIFEMNLKKSQPPLGIGRYRMLRHTKDTPISIRRELLFTWRNRWKTDGVNSLEREGGYTVLWTREVSLYTHILVDIGAPPTNLDAFRQDPQVPHKWWKQFTGC